MPKETFFKLSEEKRRRILGAAGEEFTTVPYSEASINRIVKNAQIPRGSFYQYFEDKEDLFFYYMRSHGKFIMQTVSRGIDETGGRPVCCPARICGQTAAHRVPWRTSESTDHTVRSLGVSGDVEWDHFAGSARVAPSHCPEIYQQGLGSCGYEPAEPRRF